MAEEWKSVEGVESPKSRLIPVEVGILPDNSGTAPTGSMVGIHGGGGAEANKHTIDRAHSWQRCNLKHEYGSLRTNKTPHYGGEDGREQDVVYAVPGQSAARPTTTVSDRWVVQNCQGFPRISSATQFRRSENAQRLPKSAGFKGLNPLVH